MADKVCSICDEPIVTRFMDVGNSEGSKLCEDCASLCFGIIYDAKKRIEEVPPKPIID